VITLIWTTLALLCIVLGFVGELIDERIIIGTLEWFVAVTLPSGLSCASCGGVLRWEGGRGDCSCGARVDLLGKQIPDFLGSYDGSAEVVWRWPSGFIRRVKPWLTALRSGAPAPPESVSELQHAGLIDPDSRLTPLGTRAAYDLSEHSHQAQVRKLFPHTFIASRDDGSRVLDIGGGAGQTLLALHLDSTCELVCLDKNPIPLAIGCRLTEDRVRSVDYVRASGEAIPFVDGNFTHVICRLSLQNMHLGRALREAVRVLRRGGLLYCLVEGPGYDWQLLRNAVNRRERMRLVRDLLVGVGVAATGQQPIKEGHFRANRVFGTIGRYRKILAIAGCEILEYHASSRIGPLPINFHLVARRKEDMPQQQVRFPLSSE
jgi:SAM-dependent methyltransferase